MKIEEIAEAIAMLPPDQLARFRRWFAAFEAFRSLCSFHALVKDRPIRASLPAIKLMKSDPAAVEAQREEIIIRYSKIFGAS